MHITPEQLYVTCFLTRVRIHAYPETGFKSLFKRRGMVYWIVPGPGKGVCVGYIRDKDLTPNLLKLCCERLTQQGRNYLWENICT